MVTQRDLFDRVVRRRIALERYSAAQVRIILRYLQTVENDLTTLLGSAPTDASGVLLSRAQNRVQQSVRQLYVDAYARLEKLLTGDFRGLAQAQAEFETEVMGVAADIANTKSKATGSAKLSLDDFNSISARSAYVVATAKPMSGKFLKDWVSDLSDGQIARVEQVIRQSYTEGSGFSDMMKRVRDATQLNRRAAEALVRTANTHISSAVAAASYEANKDYISGWQFVAVLDSRTTLICAGLDGKVFRVGVGPVPPRHINCRSTTIPIVIGAKPTARTTYNDWLKRQGVEVQNDILGPSRADLFRSGAYPVERFTNVTGKTLTLAQLKKG